MAKHNTITSTIHSIELTEDEYATMQHGHLVKIRLGNDGFLIIRHSVNGD